MHPTNQGLSRRSILRYGAAATGLTALALAGCAESGDAPSGDGTPAGNAALRMSAYGSTSRQQKLARRGSRRRGRRSPSARLRRPSTAAGSMRR
mgnify:CR=1 FL=1